MKMKGCLPDNLKFKASQGTTRGCKKRDNGIAKYVPVPVVRQYVYKLSVGSHVRPVGFASDYRCVGRPVPLAEAEACTVSVGD